MISPNVVGSRLRKPKARYVVTIVAMIAALTTWFASPSPAATTPTIATQALTPVTIGSSINDTATVTGAASPAPTGTVTFTLFGPANPTCTGGPIFTSANRPLGGGPPPTANSGAFTPTSPGSYNWVAVYSGDANYNSVASPCGAPNETSVVNAAPTILVDKTASPLSRPEPGGDFTYTITVTNSGTTSVTITTLTDNIYGNIATRPGSTCGARIGTTLAPGATSAPCSFTGNFFGNPGASETDIVTATAVDANGNQATDSDDATVTITNVLPTITVDKTATPATLLEPGGNVTFAVTVTNTAPEPVTITSLTDDVYGNLATKGSCTTAVGTVLAASPGPGNTYNCSFTELFEGAAGASQTDKVTATVIDTSGDTATASDTATVAIASRLNVTKTPNPASRPEPGGSFSYTVVVTNNGPDNLTIDELNDSVAGNLDTRPGSSCVGAVGTTIAANGGAYTCQFSDDFTGGPGESRINTVLVKASNATDQFMGTANATVTITDSPSSLNVSKTALPPSRGAPGGTFVFRVTVTNTSAGDTITIKTITDDVYGNLVGALGSEPCGDLVGTVLDPGETATCNFFGEFTGAVGASQTDVVTVTALDDDGKTLTASDTATVTITNASAAVTPTTPTTARPTTITTRPPTTTTTTAPVRGPDAFLTPTSGSPGDAVIINGFAWNAFENLTITFNSHPVQIAALQADATGGFSVIANVPLDATLGNHTVVILGSTGRSVSRPFTVVAEDARPAGAAIDATGRAGTTASTLRSGTLVRTGPSAMRQVWLALVLLVLGGAGVMVAGRRRTLRSGQA